MFSWGLIVLCIAFCKNFTQLAVLRALQGLAECTISPAFLVITGSWYRSNEHAHRSIIWGTANAGFGTISSLISYGVGHAAQNAGDINAAWKYISYYLGGLTILVSIPVFFILGTPREAWWLTPEEKRMAIARVLSNQTGSDREKKGYINWVHVREVFIDPQTYFLFFAVFIGSLPNGGVTTYINLVYTSFGFVSVLYIACENHVDDYRRPPLRLSSKERCPMMCCPPYGSCLSVTSLSNEKVYDVRITVSFLLFSG